MIPREALILLKFVRKLSDTEKAYIAGFLDGDGSIYIRIKPNTEYRFNFQISPAVVFYQGKKEKKHLEGLKKNLGIGYIRERNDGIVEYIIGSVENIEKLLKLILPYLRIKRKQAKLMLRVLNLKKSRKSVQNFVKMVELIDIFQELNYSKKRIQNFNKVKKTLQKEGLIAP